MTEMIFTQGKTELKLTCTLNVDMLRCSVEYSFKLVQREKGKRKWRHINEESHGYYANTDMENILKYLLKKQVIGLAELEYKKYAPSNILFNE